MIKRSDEKLVLTFQRKVFRYTFGTLRESEEGWRKYNFVLSLDFGEQDIVTVVKFQ